MRHLTWPHRLARVAAIGVLLASTGLARQAVAAPSARELERAEALATEAKAYFKGKLFEQAAAKFLEAFAVARRPALVFNAARAYEEAQKPKRAVAIFQMYADLPESSPQGRADAKVRIATLNKGIAAAEAAATKAADADTRLPGNGEAGDGDKRPGGKTVSSRAVGGKAAGAHTTTAPRKRPYPVWRSTAGSALTVFAIGAWLNARSLASEMPFDEVVDDETKARYLELGDDARLWQGLAIGSAMVGVGLIAWGQAEYWLFQPATPDKAKRSASSLAPLLLSDGVGWSFRAEF